MTHTGRYLTVLAAALAAVGVVWADSAPPRRSGPTVREAAPDFTLQDAQGKTMVRLSDLRAKPVVLLFGSCT
jgi:cytochrome oxidase Cu insertion factor (SCO1/SenC/PrrC family)